jgi:hypothetical protein
MTMALGWGLAVELLPSFVDTNLWPATPGMSTGLKGLNDSVQVRPAPAVAASTVCLRTAADPVCLQTAADRPD